MKYFLPFLFLLTACQKSPEPRGSIGIACKAILQGAFDSASQRMTHHLSDVGEFPTHDPYTGNATSNIYDSTEVDWVLLELYNTDMQFRGSRAVILLGNGNAVDENERPVIDIQLTEVTYDSLFYVVIKHRNHLGLKWPIPINFNQYRNDAQVDFRLPIPGTVYYGGRYCMRAGDATGNHILRGNGPGNDFSEISDNKGRYGYNRQDVNIDAHVNDRDTQDLMRWIKLSDVIKEQL